MPRFTQDDLARILAQKHYQAVPTGLCNPLPKQDAQLQPLGQDQDEEGGAGRFGVFIERRGARLLDADNLAGSVKFILDALRYRKLIPEDNPAAIDLQISQAIVPKEERGTYIEITPCK